MRVIKRIAVVTESFLPSINGVTNSVIRVLETLKQRDLDAMVIAPTSPSQRHLGFPVHQTTALPVLQFPVAFPGPSITRALDEFHPDVIHVAAPFMLGAQALAWGARNRVPTVAVYQTDLAGYLNRYNLAFVRPAVDKMMAAIHAPADINLAPTPQSADYLNGLGLSNVKVWGRGVDADLFSPDRKLEPETALLRRELAPGGELLVGFVGRLAVEKQVHRMRELMHIPGVRFVVVGEGPERARLQQLFAGYPVSFLGRLTGLELARAYAALDIFVHFGTEETFGQTIQEAQASALAVVAPAAGGPLHLISHRKTGLLADPGADPLSDSSYCGQVLQLVKGEKLRLQMSADARQRVLNKTWAANNQQLLEHYESAREVSMARASKVVQLELA